LSTTQNLKLILGFILEKKLILGLNPVDKIGVFGCPVGLVIGVFLGEVISLRKKGRLARIELAPRADCNYFPQARILAVIRQPPS